MKTKLKINIKYLIPISTKQNGILKTETLYPPTCIRQDSKGIRYSIQAERQQRNRKKSAFFFSEKVPKRLIPVFLLNKEPNPARADGHYF